MVKPLHFGNTITRMVVSHIPVPLVFPSQKSKIASIKNFIGEMFLFYKGNLIIENISLFFMVLWPSGGHAFQYYAGGAVGKIIISRLNI